MIRRILNGLILIVFVSGILLWNFAFTAQEPLLVHPQIFAQQMSPITVANYSTGSANFDDLAPNVTDAVVAIDVYRKTPNFAWEFDTNGFDDYAFNKKTNYRNSRVASGTGFFVTNDGYILTNAHVVFDDSATYQVALTNGKEVSANVVYKDTEQDLALLKIDGLNYPTLKLGNSKTLKTGQHVMGIGNAFGQYENVVSMGQISGFNRNIIAQGPVDDERLVGLIETNTPMYPGDSGGPLFNASGEVVGVNVAVAADSQESFTIPINTAKKFLEEHDVSL